MKALVLYTNTGGGHRSAARATAEALEKLSVKVELVDTLGIAGKHVSERTSKIYNTVVRKSPVIFGMFYSAGKSVSKPNKRSIVYRLNSLYAPKLNSIIREEKPDIIVCTHLFAGQTVTQIEKKFGLNAVTSAIITDYTYSPMWEETALDYYFIPHKDLISQFTKKQIPEEKIFPMGLPVKSAFKLHGNKREAKLKNGYDPDKFHILIAGGSMGAGSIFDTAICLSENMRDAAVTIICGSNEKLFDKLKSQSFNKNIKILKVTEKMPELMDCADIIITKPGGLTSTEAMVKGMPFIIITPIPGGEEDNCDFFVKRNMAVYSKSTYETVELCNMFREDHHVTVQMIEAQRKNMYPDSGSEIARFLIDKVRDRRE